jgi:hypothetical protein
MESDVCGGLTCPSSLRSGFQRMMPGLGETGPFAIWDPRGRKQFCKVEGLAGQLRSDGTGSQSPTCRDSQYQVADSLQGKNPDC